MKRVHVWMMRRSGVHLAIRQKQSPRIKRVHSGGRKRDPVRGCHAGRTFGRFDTEAESDDPKNGDGGDDAADGGDDERRVGGRRRVVERRGGQGVDRRRRFDLRDGERRVIKRKRDA